jgi:N-hydroxyarylamine O-acetyltransferase
MVDRDLGEYFERIVYRGVREPTEGTLSALIDAHVRSIPFENIDVLLGRAICIDSDSIHRKLVGARRGGYCFEHNTLFADVLESLGFTVQRLGARVRWQATTPRPRTHMLLEVALSDGPRIVDVGFGARGIRSSLRVDEGIQRVAGRTFRIRCEPHVRVLSIQDATGEFQDLYAFTREPLLAIDFEMANWFTSTHPLSSFREHLMAMRADDQGERTLMDDQLVIRDRGSVVKRALSDIPEILSVLQNEFGIRLPPGAEELEIPALRRS